MGAAVLESVPDREEKKRVRVSLNNFDHTSRQSDTRAYEYIHLNAPRRPKKYCPDFLNGSENGRSALSRTSLAGSRSPDDRYFSLVARKPPDCPPPPQFFSPLASSSFRGQLHLFPETCKFMRCGKGERKR